MVTWWSHAMEDSIKWEQRWVVSKACLHWHMTLVIWKHVHIVISLIFLCLQICDMVAIARYLNVTLIVPELDKTSFWADPRCVNVSLPLHICSYWTFPSFKRMYDFSSLICVAGFCFLHVKWIFMNYCCSEFQDIFDVDHFITSLRDEVRILKELPPRLKRRVELGTVYSMPPISWSDISYYHYQVSFKLFLAPSVRRERQNIARCKT